MPSKTAIVCDDDRTFASIIQFVLIKKGFSAQTAENGTAALPLIKDSQPGLVFLDLEMPEKDGFAVLEEMKGFQGAKPYVIVLSSHEAKTIHDRAYSLGANEVWVKPFNASELLKRLEGLIEQGKI